MNVQRTEGFKGAYDGSARNQVGASDPQSASVAEAVGRYDPFDLLPRLQAQREFAEYGARQGIRQPYFLVHEALASASTVIDNRRLLNFSSYDYLGFNQHPDVHRAAIEAIGRYGVSPSASRLVAGEREIHGLLEAALARHYEHDDCLSFVSGYGTNVSVIATLMGPDDLVLVDSLAHNSIIAGAKLSGAKIRSFPHNDLEALDAALGWRRRCYRRVLIVAEGFYSMDGDVCDLPRLVEIKERHGVGLMIDDAHGLGVLGENGYGAFEHFGVDPRRVDIWMGTLSKALASCGGYVAASSALIEYLRWNAGGFIFSVALAPAFAAAALAAYDLLLASRDKVRRLRENSRLFARSARSVGLNLGNSIGEAIIPVMIPDAVEALAASSRLQDRGINVQPIIHPAVDNGAARLRFFINSEHSSDDMEFAVSCVSEVVQRIKAGAEPPMAQATE